MIKVFMVLITEAVNGGLGGAFAVQTDDDACRTRLPAIVAMIEQSGPIVREAVCTRASWPFTAFQHAQGSEQERHYYSVEFTDSESQPVAVRPVADSAECEGAEQRDPSVRRYCVSSVQDWTG